jgi:hypothetical protein
MDVTIKVSWEDGQVTRHEISNLPELSSEALQEELEQDLASWVEPEALPLSDEGWALGWTSVEIESADETLADYASCEVSARA